MKVKSVISIAIFLDIASALKFQPFNKSLLSEDSFLEQFDYKDLANSPWISSRAKKFDEGRDEIVSYKGRWEIAPPEVYPGYEDDKGLVLRSKAAHHAIARTLPRPIDNKGKDLVLQYEVKLQKGLSCGGAYIKLLDVSSGSDYSRFSSETPYQIMFGPDICGSNNKIHFILRRKSIEGSNIEEKHLKHPPMARTGDLSTLYTLIIHDNQDFEIRINGETAKAGNLVSQPNLFDPTFSPPKEIIDPDDKQPADWDDRLHIADPNAKKPADYDAKHARRFIPDPAAVKPDSWDEDAPRYIPDPNEVKPEGVPDDEWKPTLLINPKCRTSGCGPWNPPQIPNPDYIGPWFAPEIINPNFQGLWKPKRIPNPAYYETIHPGRVDKPIGGIGFELWSMDADVLFDNIYIGHSVPEAELIGNATFVTKLQLEYENKKSARPKVKNEPMKPPKSFDEIMADNDIATYKQFILFVRMFWRKQYLEVKDFYFEFMLDPVNLIMEKPGRFFVYTTLFMFGATFAFGIGSTIMFLVSNIGGSDREEEGHEVVAEEKEDSNDSPRIEILDEVIGEESTSVKQSENDNVRKRSVV